MSLEFEDLNPKTTPLMSLLSVAIASSAIKPSAAILFTLLLPEHIMALILIKLFLVPSGMCWKTIAFPSQIAFNNTITIYSTTKFEDTLSKNIHLSAPFVSKAISSQRTEIKGSHFAQDNQEVPLHTVALLSASVGNTLSYMSWQNCFRSRSLCCLFPASTFHLIHGMSLSELISCLHDLFYCYRYRKTQQHLHSLPYTLLHIFISIACINPAQIAWNKFHVYVIFLALQIHENSTVCTPSAICPPYPTFYLSPAPTDLQTPFELVSCLHNIPSPTMDPWKLNSTPLSDIHPSYTHFHLLPPSTCI